MDIPQMTLVAWLVVGAIAGFLASEIMGAREGLVMMVVLGIVGAIVGGWIAADVLKIANVTGINLTSIVVAVVGAVIVIFVVGQPGRPPQRSFRLGPLIRARSAHTSLSKPSSRIGPRTGPILLFPKRTASSSTVPARDRSLASGNSNESSTLASRKGVALDIRLMPGCGAHRPRRWRRPSMPSSARS